MIRGQKPLPGYAPYGFGIIRGICEWPVALVVARRPVIGYNLK